MGFFDRRRASKREKKINKATTQDMQLIACDRMTVLIEMTANADYKIMIEGLREDMKFISPCQSNDAEKAENKILAKLDDLKIVISNPRKDNRVSDEISELRVLIAERKIITN